jgi:hypothetical protein
MSYSMALSSKIKGTVSGFGIDGLLKRADTYQGPIDLFRLAKYLRVQSIEKRLMIPRGGLELVKGGFKVYIRDLGLSSPRALVDSTDLSPLDRIVLAHEIAHTLFYRFTDDWPTAVPCELDPTELEDACNWAAGEILVPPGLLEPRVRDDVERCSDVVIAVESDFAVSSAFAVERIESAYPRWPEKGIMVVESIRDGALVVKASWFGAALMPVVREPEKGRMITREDRTWGRVVATAAGGEWDLEREKRLIRCRKLRDPFSGKCFLVDLSADGTAVARGS